LQNTPCNKCGRGARCVYGKYCTAFCKTVTIAYEERFRKYCPRLGQYNPFLHHFGKRSVSRSERSADAGMMEIEYKVPFLDMLDDFLNHTITTGFNRAAIVSMFTEIAEDVEIDAENCDTPTNALAAIAGLARASATFSSRTSIQRTYDFIGNLILTFESLDDSGIECEVEDSPSYPFKSRYGKQCTQGKNACPEDSPFCTGFCVHDRGCLFGSCRGRG